MTDQEIMNYVAEHIETKSYLREIYEEMQKISPGTFQHCFNVGMIALRIGRDYGLKESDLIDLTLAGVLHDIGKMRVPKSLLDSTKTYSVSEFEQMKKHPELGYDLLKKEKKCVRKAVLEHHENFNGTGYPYKKYKNRISLYGRIIRIADVVDAMTSERAYKESVAWSDTCDYLASEKNILFDGDLLDKYFSIVEYTEREE